MIINAQAFASKSKDSLRIYDELDDFQSRRPIDVIARNRPILILDEPQKLRGQATTESMKRFTPLFILRYSATHAEEHNKIYRLDALDAYNRKRQMTDSKIKSAKKLLASGVPPRDVATNLGVSVPTLYRWIPASTQP